MVAFEFLCAVIATTDGGSPTITWPALSGQTFRVEYKTNLTDSLWQNISAPVTITGNRGHLTDPASASGHRFYRVVLEN